MKEPDNNDHKLIFLRPDDREKGRMDIGRFFSSMPTPVLFLLMVIFYSLVVGLGIFIGYEKFRNGVVTPESPTETEVGAILGLLAFMLGFCFSATWTRFINRNRFVVNHAKNLRVCYLRTSLIPERQRIESRRLLQEYITIMLAIQVAPERSLARIDELHSLIWQQTASLVNEEMDSEIRSLFTISVNDLISLAMERKAVALFVRIPNAIWGALLFLAVVGLLAFGYQSGVHGMRSIFQMSLLPMAFSVVVVLIADLNSSYPQRHFKVTQRPLRELLRMMQSFDTMATR